MIDALGAALQAVDFQIAGAPVSRAEWLGAVLGLAMVVCNARLHPMGWVLAILSSLLYGIVFLGSRLYGQAALQLLFAVMAAWGLRQWMGAVPASGAADALTPQPLPAARRRLVLLATLLLWGLLGSALMLATDSPVPFADALPTAGSIAATWLLAQRHTENWGAWLAVNVFSVGLFAHQALWLTAGLYVVFAAMSLWGWRAWRLRERNPWPAE